MPLLSDWNGALAERLGVARVRRSMNGVPYRSVFLIAGDATVLGRWLYDDDQLPDFDVLAEAAGRLRG